MSGAAPSVAPSLDADSLAPAFGLVLPLALADTRSPIAEKRVDVNFVSY